MLGHVLCLDSGHVGLELPELPEAVWLPVDSCHVDVAAEALSRPGCTVHCGQAGVVLECLGASVRLRSLAGERWVAVEDLREAQGLELRLVRYGDLVGGSQASRAPPWAFRGLVLQNDAVGLCIESFQGQQAGHGRAKLDDS